MRPTPAMNIAHYQLRYGELPLEEQLAITSKLNDHHAQLLTKGMETMAGVLGNIIQGLDEIISHQSLAMRGRFVRYLRRSQWQQRCRYCQLKTIRH
jgi:hypothetical protein